MRPFVVACLVLVAIGALVAALFAVIGGNGDSRGRGDAPVTLIERPAEGSRPQSPVELTGSAQTAPIENRSPEGVSATPTAMREAQGTTGGWNNAVAVTVLDPDGQPVPGAQLSLVRQAGPTQFALLQLAGSSSDYKPLFATTREDGTARFGGLEPAGDWTLSVVHPDYAYKERPGIQVGREGEVQVSVPLSNGIVCQGWVLDLAGNPVGGAKLEMMNNIVAHLPGVDPRANRDLLRAESDSTGFFEFSNVAPGARHLTVSAEGYGSQARNNLVFQKGKEPEAVEFRLQPGLCISGRVFGADFVGIQGAQVEATSFGATISSKGTAVTDAEGYFEICGLTDVGEFIVIARAADYRENRDNAHTRAGDANLQIEMARLGGVTGRLVDCRTGEPLRGPFRVQVRQVSANAAIYGRPILSRAFPNASGTGAFEIHGLDEATWVVQGTAEGYAPTFSDTFTIAQGMTTPDVEVCMSRGGVISGRVVDAATREPVAGARIATFDNSYFDNPFNEIFKGMIPRMTADKKAVTDEDGYFELEGLNQETYQLQISNPDHSTKIIKDRLIVDGSTDDLGTITLSRGAIVRGTVYDAAGQPLPVAEVQMMALGTQSLGRSYKTITDSDGRYELRSVAEGGYRMHATRGDDGGNPFEKILDMKNSETNITVSEGATYQRDLHLGG